MQVSLVAIFPSPCKDIVVAHCTREVEATMNDISSTDILPDFTDPEPLTTSPFLKKLDDYFVVVHINTRCYTLIIFSLNKHVEHKTFNI